MSNQVQPPVIRLRGVRHHNLKNFDIDLPLRKLIVITGLSGSGKSTLAFDTLFAEGQRRYIETFSPYARQFFDRMDKPQVDSIEGIPPAIAIEQRNSVRTTRSTVGTMTEICDYLKVLWPQVAQLHCRKCGQPVRREPPQAVWEDFKSSSFSSSSSNPRQVENEDEGRGRVLELLVTFDLPLSEKLSFGDSIALVAKQGYQRLLIKGEVVRLDELAIRNPQSAIRNCLTVVQDRLRLAPANRARFVEACEQAYHFGKGKLTVFELGKTGKPHNPHFFSAGLHCATCDLDYREPSTALFSFNHPLGACPKCKGFGRVISIDYHLAIPDRSKTLAQGAVKPWQSGMSAECQQDLKRFCKASDIPMDVPFARLPERQQNLVINGEPDYGTDEEHQWPRAWYGVKGYFRWLETKSYKMHVRVLLSRYRAYTTCPDCQGQRFQPEALLYRLVVAADVRRLQLSARIESEPPHVGCYNLADFYALPIRDALHVVDELAAGLKSKRVDPLWLALQEVRSRLGYLYEVGLGYLTLDRPTRTLSGGETERVNLTTCLGTGLVNTLFVLDEPSVGLHPRDTDRLVKILQRLRDTGNTVVVVEHEASVIRAADQVVDLGPGHGATGGEVVFQGTLAELRKHRVSLTGQYLSGRKRIEVPARRIVPLECGDLSPLFLAGDLSPAAARPVAPQKSADESAHSKGPVRYAPATTATWELKDALPGALNQQDACPTLKLTHATRHNLKELSVEIPLGRLVCVTGVSGSGKTTLIREVLLPALKARLEATPEIPNASDRADSGEEGDGELSTLNSHLSTALTGWESLGHVVLVDQSSLGKTPRSNPAVYIGAFDDIRELFADSPAAQQRGLSASAFSFNSAQGQCARCRGAGFEKIEMQFLSDVFIRCPECGGRRYRDHIMEVKVAATLECGDSSPLSLAGDLSPAASVRRVAQRKSADKSAHSKGRTVVWSIADMLEATVDEVIEFLGAFADSRHAQRAAEKLNLLQEVGLGYLRLGQPINTLSGGESQRLKLVSHLAESVAADVRRLNSESAMRNAQSAIDQSLLTSAATKSTLFLFDEPTTGLHFDDVRVLMLAFQRLVDSGHSVVIIEHNLDVIKCADWVIDLGPDAGDQGGQLVACGTPEDVAKCEASHTGKALREVLGRNRDARETGRKGTGRKGDSGTFP